MKIARVTLSDRASAGVYEDLSGPEIERVVCEIFGDATMLARLLPDDQEELERVLVELVEAERCDLIFTTGGTGPAARDITPEATRAVIQKELPGFGEVMRAVSFQTVPTAILSRATAGIRDRTLIVNLPGNPRAISQCLPPLKAAIEECLRHLA